MQTNGDDVAAVILPYRSSSNLPTFSDKLAKNNPFYLLSAMCMLLACLMLSNTTTWSPIRIQRLVLLLTTVNIYELLLLGLAIFLVRRGVWRDAKMLLILQAVFMTDVTFLNAESVSTNFSIGVALNIGLVVLTLIKIGVIVQLVKLRMTTAQAGQCIIQILWLFALPIIMQITQRSPGEFYGIWWTIGLLPVLYQLLDRFLPRLHSDDDLARADSPVPTSLYLVLPWLSLVLHLFILHYVYNSTWQGAMFAPLLLGGAVLVKQHLTDKSMPKDQRHVVVMILATVAVIVSFTNAYELSFFFNDRKFGPLLFSMMSAYSLFVWCYVPRNAIWYLSAGFAFLIWYTFGPSARQVKSTGGGITDWIDEHLIPHSMAAWGLIGLVASFALLAVGAWVSLKSSVQSRVQTEVKDS